MDYSSFRKLVKDFGYPGVVFIWDANTENPPVRRFLQFLWAPGIMGLQQEWKNCGSGHTVRRIKHFFINI